MHADGKIFTTVHRSHHSYFIENARTWHKCLLTFTHNQVVLETKAIPKLACIVSVHINLFLDWITHPKKSTRVVEQIVHIFCSHYYPKYLNYKMIFKETKNWPYDETSLLYSSLPRKYASLVQETRHYFLLHSQLSYILAPVGSRLQISWFLLGACNIRYRAQEWPEHESIKNVFCKLTVRIDRSVSRSITPKTQMAE